MKYVRTHKSGEGFGATFQQIIATIGLAKQFGLQYVYDQKFLSLGGHGYNNKIMHKVLIDLEQLYPQTYENIPCDQALDDIDVLIERYREGDF